MIDYAFKSEVIKSGLPNIQKQVSKTFYAEHNGRPFFEELVNFMSSAPIVVQVLEGEDAIVKYRTVMGKTDPLEADKGTIRAEFAESKGRNSVHGSDSPASAQREIAQWFSSNEIVG